MKKRSLIVAALLIAALLAAVFPVAASEPSGVSIVAIMYVNPTDPTTGPMSGTFVASGTAVDAGLLCSAGTVQDIENPAHAWQSGQVIVLYVHKHFTCSDGSGTFEMNMRVLLGSNGTVARWVISGADGPYAGLLGTGGVTGVWLEDGSLQDTYSGRLHIE